MIEIEKVEISVDEEKVYRFRRHVDKLFRSIFTWPLAVAYKRALIAVDL